MKSITYEEFLEFEPCWLKTEDGAARLKKIGARKERWTALDILALDDVDAEDKLWAVLREELIDARLLHEFSCWCAEDALSHVENADERSWNAVKVKRAWLRGEASDAELDIARDTAWAVALAAVASTPWKMEWNSVPFDVLLAIDRREALSVAWAATWDSTRDAAWAAARCNARAATRYDARDWQVERLKGMLMEEDKCC